MANPNIGESRKKNGGDDLEHQNRNDEENRIQSIVADEVGKALAGFMALLKALAGFMATLKGW